MVGEKFSDRVDKRVGEMGGDKVGDKQGWIFLRDLRDYLIDNLDKFRQSSPGTKV